VNIAIPLDGILFNINVNLSALTEMFIAGFAGNDTIIGSASGEEIDGGLGADNLNGGDGADSYQFAQGDSPAVTFNDIGLGSAGTVGANDTFTFLAFAPSGSAIAELISGGFTVTGQNGDKINLNTSQDNVQSLTPITLPTNGMVTDQKFFLVRGDLAGATFTVSTIFGGGSTLVVYDGDASTGGFSQTAFVLSNVLPGALTTNLYSSQIFLA